jgi:hypothetical protein
MIRIRDGECVEASLEDDPRHSIQQQYRIANQATELLERARAAGVILAIEQAARPPLAMGNHVDVVTVYAARKMAEQGGVA